MRLKNIPPAQYTAAQQTLANTLNQGIEKHLQGFVIKRSDGALIGPFNILLQLKLVSAGEGYIRIVMPRYRASSRN